MANPARVLHSIYAGWRQQLSQQTSSMTSVVNLDTVDGGHAISEAARALIRIDDLFAILEAGGANVELYRRQYPEWWKGLVSFKSGWSSNMSGTHVLSDMHMDEIEGFANYLDGKVYEFPAQSVSTLQDAISQARKILESDTELSHELRIYIHRLLQQVQNALDDDRIGSTFDYGEAVMRLFVATKAAESERTGKSSRWANLRDSILPSAGLAAMIEAGSVAAQLMIGG